MTVKKDQGSSLIKQINAQEFPTGFEFSWKQRKQIQKGQSLQESFTDNRIWQCKFKEKMKEHHF